MQAEAPAAGGTIVSVQWDFDGKGTYPYSDPSVDGTATSVTLDDDARVRRAWDVLRHRAGVRRTAEGDVNAKHRRLQNLASARVVVR